jgi:hypothetical protein
LASPSAVGSGAFGALVLAEATGVGAADAGMLETFMDGFLLIVGRLWAGGYKGFMNPARKSAHVSLHDERQVARFVKIVSVA